MVWYGHYLSLSEFLASPGVTHTPPPHTTEGSWKGWYLMDCWDGSPGTSLAHPFPFPSPSLPLSFLLPPCILTPPTHHLPSSLHCPPFSQPPSFIPPSSLIPPSLISGYPPPHRSLSARLSTGHCGSRFILCGQLPLTSPVRTSTSHLCSAPVLPGTTDDHQLSLPPSLALTHAYGQRFSLLPEDKALCSDSPGGE